MDDRGAFGEHGERIARGYLRKRGYRILGSRWRVRGGEIDLIAMEGGEVVFIEVKARRSTGFGRPECAVDARKRRRLRSAAWEYLVRHGLEGWPYRIDVIAIECSGADDIRLVHIRSAVSEAD